MKKSRIMIRKTQQYLKPINSITYFLQRLNCIHLGDDLMRRSKNDVAVDILRVAMKGAKITHIVYEVNLNFKIATKYLELLKDKELIRQENGLFITTDKGKVFQEIAKELKL
jgi:predicted transcriptional regulator